MTWEEIDGYSERAKVFGGWLVRCYEPYWDGDQQYEYRYVAMAFIPDPNHEWEIDNAPDKS